MGILSWSVHLFICASIVVLLLPSTSKRNGGRRRECRAAFKASLHQPSVYGQIASEAGDLIFNAISASSSGT